MPGPRQPQPLTFRLLGGRPWGRAQGEADEGQHDPEDEGHAGDTEGYDRGEERGLEERRVHGGLTLRVVLRELRVGLAAGDGLGVVVDDVGLAVRRDGTVDVVARR